MLTSTAFEVHACSEILSVLLVFTWVPLKQRNAEVASNEAELGHQGHTRFRELEGQGRRTNWTILQDPANDRPPASTLKQEMVQS